MCVAGLIFTDARAERRLHEGDDNDKRFGRVPGSGDGIDERL